MLSQREGTWTVMVGKRYQKNRGSVSKSQIYMTRFDLVERETVVLFEQHVNIHVPTCEQCHVSCGGHSTGIPFDRWV